MQWVSRYNINSDVFWNTLALGFITDVAILLHLSHQSPGSCPTLCSSSCNNSQGLVSSVYLIPLKPAELEYQHAQTQSPRRASMLPGRQFKTRRGMLVDCPSSRLYTCDICGSTFTKSFNLTRHRGKCAGTRIYYCHICNKPFYRTDKLRIHLLKKHPTQILYSDF